MASCDIINGREEVCLDNVGGIKNIYFVNWDDLDEGDITMATYGIISAINTTPAKPNAFKFELIATTNTFDEVGETSRDNGTVVYTGTLTANLKKIRSSDAVNLKALATGRPRVLIEYNTGIVRLAGLANGVTTSITNNSGGALGDFSGYVLTIVSIEKEMAPFLGEDIEDFFTIETES